MMDVVASVVAPDLSQMNAKQRKNWVMGALKNSGYKTEVQGFGVVEYGENQIDSSLNYLNSMEEVAAFLCLPRVLKCGIRTRGHENHKGRSFDTVTFAAPVEINGVRGNMAVVVKQIKRNLYKTHRILMPDGFAFSFDNKKTEPTPAVGTPPMREAQETRINSANISIPPSEEHVNPGMKNSDRDITDQTETAASVYERYLDVSKRLNEARNKESAAKKAWNATGEMDEVLDLIIKKDSVTAKGLLDKARGANKFAQQTNAVNNSVPQHSENVNTDVQNSLRDQTDTEAFKRWFGNSQVVNEDGSPKVMHKNFSKNPKKFQKTCFNPPDVCYHNIRQGEHPEPQKR